MSLIRNGEAVSRGQGFLAVLLAALLALFVFCPNVATAQEMNQINVSQKIHCACCEQFASLPNSIFQLSRTRRARLSSRHLHCRKSRGNAFAMR